MTDERAELDRSGLGSDKGDFDRRRFSAGKSREFPTEEVTLFDRSRRGADDLQARGHANFDADALGAGLAPVSERQRGATLLADVHGTQQLPGRGDRRRRLRRLAGGVNDGWRVSTRCRDGRGREVVELKELLRRGSCRSRRLATREDLRCVGGIERHVRCLRLR